MFFTLLLIHEEYGMVLNVFFFFRVNLIVIILTN